MKRRSFLQVGMLTAADGGSAHLTGGAPLYSALIDDRGRAVMTNPYPIPRSIRQTDILVGNGSKMYGPFDGFQIFDNEDVVVWSRATTADAFEKVDVTVAKVSGLSFDFFTVEFAARVPDTTEFVVSSERVAERSVGVKKGTMLDMTALERELSKQATVLQELRRDLDRALKVQFKHQPAAVPGAQNNRVLGWHDGVLANIEPAEFINDAGFATAEQGSKADMAWQPTTDEDVFGSAINSARIYGRVRDTVAILDYATTKAQRDAIRNGNVGFKAAFDDAAADAGARGIKVVNFPDGNFELDSGLTLANPGLYVRGEVGGTWLYKNGSGRMFQTLGSAPNTATDGFPLTADADAGAVSVTMSPANAANFAVGRRAILWAHIATASNSALDAEYVWITGVNIGAGVITFASPIHFAYTTVNTAKLFNVTLVEGVGYENLIIDWTDGTQTTPQRPPYRIDEAIVSWFCLKPRFVNIETKNTINETISLHGCVDAYVRTLRGVNGFSDAVDLTNAFSYGIHEQGVNVGLIATDLYFERHRHGYTTGAPDAADPTMFNGGHPIGSVISNGVHRWAKAAGWDTHDIGIDIWFDNLFTEGGFQAGMQIRTTRAHVIDCGASDIQAYGGVPGHGLFLVGGDASNLWARDTRIDGFEAYNVAGAGIRDQSPGTIAKNIVVERAQGNVISWDGGASGDGEYSDIYAKDVAKNPAVGGAFAVSLGNAANQKSARIRDMFVDDPNNNLSALVRRTNAATDKLEITNVRGLNSTKAPIDVFSDPTSTANVTIRGGYGVSGNNVGPINAVAIASDSINADGLYAAGALLTPQTGTADALVTITGGERDSIIVLWGGSGNKITLTHGTGTDNLFLRGASNVNLLANQGLALMRRGAVWIELWRTF
jgi:hypothetical protein